MAMRPLHRAGAGTAAAPGLPWRAICIDACIALAVFQIRRYRNPPIAALQLGALGEMLVKQRTLVATIFWPSETKRRLSSLHMASHSLSHS